jgi:glycosyltransferase involved in cell wall biosynthesis
MISFIVIGKNEGWKISLCIKSIFEFIEFNNLMNFEIIYIDSSSIDDSIERVSSFKNIKIYKIEGEINAAIARNCGYNNSTGQILFFIDGDMEIEKHFLNSVYENGELKYDFVTGQFINNYFTEKGVFIKSEVYHSDLNEEIDVNYTGGIFLIKRYIYEELNGMKNFFKIGQDIDLGLRARKKGYQIIRKKNIISKHNTIHYQSKERMWKDLLRGNEFYDRSLMLRQHLFNKFYYKRFIRNDYTFALFVSILLLIILFKNTILILIYLLIQSLKTLIKHKQESTRLFEFIFYYIFRDVLTLIGIIFFYPNYSPKYTVTLINTDESTYSM